MTEIFAHRGYKEKYPENTMVAFLEAEKAKADGIELDVRLSKDGEIVVIHDETVDRTTDGTGYVHELTWKELKRLNATDKKKWSKKEHIPLLQEVFEWLQSNDLICNVEIKSHPSNFKKIEPLVIKMIHDFQLTNRIILSSFNHYSIIYCYQMDPKIEIAPLIYEGLYMPWIYTEAIRAKGFHPNYKTIPIEIIKSSIENGVAVRPYTVNKKKEMERLLKINCSAMITDDPVKAVQLRKELRIE